MVLLLALLLIHWHMVVVLIRRRWLLLLSMMTPVRRPYHVRHEHPRFSSVFVFFHPIVINVIFLCLISRERETQKREKKTDQKRDDVKVTLMFCFLSSLMPMIKTLHISFFCGSMRESIVFFAAERVTFLTDFLTSIFSILLKKKFFVSLSLSLVKRFLSLSLSRITHSLSRSSSSSMM